jgi:hypothetical protein
MLLTHISDAIDASISTNHYLSTGLRQYRGTDVPVLGDFALSIQTSDADDWGLEILSDSDESHTDLEVSTPFGSVYAMYRYW